MALGALIQPKPRDLGDGFTVRRALPAAERRNVGPFVFLDQMGPAHIPAGGGLDVRPHPHIGLATVTYLYEGEIMHRDSLGFEQAIRPGELNWMSAGAGIVHSERTPDGLRKTGANVFGLQAWVALPLDQEESEPSFHHYGAAALPQWEGENVSFTLVAGEAFGRKSPARTLSKLFYVDARMRPRASFTLDDEHEERAVYVSTGAALINGEEVSAGHLAVLTPGEHARVCANEETRVMLLGGDALDAPRHVYWNFVHSSRERIREAADLWRDGGFARVPGDDEFIPAPEAGP